MGGTLAVYLQVAQELAPAVASVRAWAMAARSSRVRYAHRRLAQQLIPLVAPLDTLVAPRVSLAVVTYCKVGASVFANTVFYDVL